MKRTPVPGHARLCCRRDGHVFESSFDTHASTSTIDLASIQADPPIPANNYVNSNAMSSSSITSSPVRNCSLPNCPSSQRYSNTGAGINSLTPMALHFLRRDQEEHNNNADLLPRIASVQPISATGSLDREHYTTADVQFRRTTLPSASDIEMTSTERVECSNQNEMSNQLQDNMSLPHRSQRRCVRVDASLRPIPILFDSESSDEDDVPFSQDFPEVLDSYSIGDRNQEGSDYESLTSDEMLHVNFMNETVSDEPERLVSQSFGNNATTPALEDMESEMFCRAFGRRLQC